jgi:hypothetical protein
MEREYLATCTDTELELQVCSSSGDVPDQTPTNIVHLPSGLHPLYLLTWSLNKSSQHGSNQMNDC